MGFRINTNIAALDAHRSSVMNNKNLDGSLARLSSGLRINKAADDASGMAIADSLRAQANGLNQAINNANDGVAVVQTADGALDEYIGIINNVRTKSIQAASDGQNADSRKAIQADIDRLLEAANSIANTTQFNGQKLLDGTFTNKSFHIGAYAGETVGLSVGNVQVGSVGDIKGYEGANTRAALVTADYVDGVAGQALKTDTLTINGTDIAGSLNTLSPVSLTDASSVATAITDATGIMAQGSNTLTGAVAIAGGTVDSTNSLKINGIAIADTTVLANDSDGALRNAINNITDQTGVTATVDTAGKLLLESNDGSNISITTSTTTAEVSQISTATYTAPTAGQTISLDVNGNTYSAVFNTDAATTYADLITAVTAGENVTGAAVGNVVTFTADAGSPTFTIANAVNGDASAGSTATTTLGVTAITAAAASDNVTGLTTDNLTSQTGAAVSTLTSSATANVTIAKGVLIINGTDMAGTYGDNVTAGTAATDLEAAIKAIDGMGDSSINALGVISLSVNNGNDLNIGGTTGASTFNLTEGITNESKAGKVTIFSDNAIKVGGTAADSFGLVSGTFAPSLTGVSLNSIDVTSRESAEVAILISDSALKQLDATRSDLGSVQNQLESTIRNISVTAVNVKSAESGIRDVDFAQESANFSKFNILAQSGSYAMSQANAVQQNVLRLLQ